MSNLLEEIENLKKAECHVHIDGAMDAERVISISNEKNIKLTFPGSKDPIDTPEKLKELWSGWDKYDIIEQFHPVINLMQTPKDLKMMAYEHVKHMAKQNIIYLETRFAPQYHRERGLRLKKIIGHTLEGLRQGAEETGMIVKLIISIGREANSRTSKKVVKAAMQYPHLGVIGIDLACDEKSNPPSVHKRAFDWASYAGLNKTIHAGEMMPTKEENYKNIEYSIHRLKTNAISHAVDLWERDDLIDIMVKNNIRLESQPQANIALGIIKTIEDLNLDKLVDAGVGVTVNSDDPSMWPNGSLSDVLYGVTKLYGLGFLKQVLVNQIDYAFGLDDEKEKKNLRYEIENQELFKNL